MWCSLAVINGIASVLGALSFTSAKSLREETKTRTLRAAVVACEDLTPPTIVENATVVDFDAQITNSSISTVCEVNVYLTHGNASDRVRIQHYLPLEDWTGRYQGNGGSGFVAGYFDEELTPAASRGFVSGSTDAGLPENASNGTQWAHDEQLLVNFAHLSVHEMTLVGKALAVQFYGAPVEHAYWNGCSTGGRQGYMEAQRYPGDYDGIFAVAPAIAYSSLRVAELYPFWLQTAADEFPPQCVWDAFENASVEACDDLDGANDGIIVDPTACLAVFDPETLVGRNISCEEDDSDAPDFVTVTELHRDMWKNITAGPPLPDGSPAFHGIPPGASFFTLTGTEPYTFGSTWVRDFIMGDPSFDLRSVAPEDTHALMALSNDMFRDIIGTDDPDLRGFRDAGGKLLSWHGSADPQIFANATIEYRQRVQEFMGAEEELDLFYRLFLAPGVAHCDGGNGAMPTGGLDELVRWVEGGEAPNRLAAEGNGISRDLCLFPLQLVYSGEGDVDDAENWGCEEPRVAQMRG